MRFSHSFADKLVLCLTLLLVPFIAGSQTREVKNIILFIGDGMGPSHIKAYRMFQDDPSTEAIEPILFDSMLVGTLSTDPKQPSYADSNSTPSISHSITDSAAAASAYATGFKGLNGHISVDENNHFLPTVLEKAKQRGLATGLVATSQISHATPAAFASHIADRNEQGIIVDQYIDRRFAKMPYIDVLLGGGKKYFVRKDRNVANEFKTLGYQLVENKKELKKANNTRLLGLFAENGLEPALDRNNQTPSLADMTHAAIQQLSKNKQGFFLLVEGSQIDWAAHNNDIVAMMAEMKDFEEAVSVGLSFAKNNPQTQIIVTADHATGGLSVGAEIKGKAYYQWSRQVIKSFTKTPQKIIALALKSGKLLQEFNAANDMKLSREEREQMTKFKPTKAKEFSQLITSLVDQKSYTGWTTHGHTSVDVNLYAYGPVSQQLAGHWQNTKIGKFVFALLAE